MRVVFMGTPSFAVPSLDALCASHEVACVFTRAGVGSPGPAP
jgi:methionyl-tRNA formyltransferase